MILILDRFLGLEEVLKNQLVTHVLQSISQREYKFQNLRKNSTLSHKYINKTFLQYLFSNVTVLTYLEIVVFQRMNYKEQSES